MNENRKTETIPIKALGLKSYSSAEDNYSKNKASVECNVNFGYDATGEEQNVTMGGSAIQKCEKVTDDSRNDKQNGEEEHDKHQRF